MGKVINIPLNTGLITNTDTEHVGQDGCTIIENALIDKNGKIYKCPPVEHRDPDNPANVHFVQNMMRIKDDAYSKTHPTSSPAPSTIQLIATHDGKIYGPYGDDDASDDASTSILEYVNSSDTIDKTQLIWDDSTTIENNKPATGIGRRWIHLQDAWPYIRVSFGPYAEPMVYMHNWYDHFYWGCWRTQDDSRGIFFPARPMKTIYASNSWSLTNWGQVGNPRLDLSSKLFLPTGDAEWKPTGGSNYTLPSNMNFETDTYYYKLTAVFDGIQEEPLPEEIACSTDSIKRDDTSVYTDDNISGSGGDDSYFGFTFASKGNRINSGTREKDFNPRWTHTNVYRAKNNPAGPYYKIDTISMIGSKAALHYEGNNTTGILAHRSVDPNVTYTHSARCLRANGSENTGYCYIVTDTIGNDAGNELRFHTSDSIASKVYDVATSTYIGITAVEEFNDDSGRVIKITNASTLGISKSFWGEPVKWTYSDAGGTGSGWNYGRMYSAYQYNNLFYSHEWNFGEDEIVGFQHVINSNDNFTGHNQDGSGVHNEGFGDTDSECFGVVSRNTTKLIAVYSSATNPVSNFVTRVAPTFTNSSGTQGDGKYQIILCGNYFWSINTDVDDNTTAKIAYCRWTDNGLTDGATHPYGTTSIKTRYHYSQFIAGRNYVANVKIENNAGQTEIHPDWVMFSELGQPDVIPITNFIQISDISGGEVMGLSTLMGDLVILHQNGIYRLSIPSNDPTQWSLLESEENIGCVAPESIVRLEEGVFFCGASDMYYLSTNFQATPVTTQIQDQYKYYMTTDLDKQRLTRCHYDRENNKLLCCFGDQGSVVHILDIEKFKAGTTAWTTGTTWGATASPKNINHFTRNITGSGITGVGSDTSIACLTDTQYEDGDANFGESRVAKLFPKNNLGYPTVDLSMKRRTGWIKYSDLGEIGIVRRLNLRYTSVDDLTVKFYIDGNDQTAVGTYTIPGNLSGQISAATKANPCVLTMLYRESATTTGDKEIAFSTEVGQKVVPRGIKGMTQLNGNVYTVSAVTDDGSGGYTVSLDVDSSGFGTLDVTANYGRLFPADDSHKIKPSIRCKMLMVEIESASSGSSGPVETLDDTIIDTRHACEINRIEVEFE